jgi:flavin-binding protein dodecin
MTMIRVAELREAVDRARFSINDTRVFDVVMAK